MALAFLHPQVQRLAPTPSGVGQLAWAEKPVPSTSALGAVGTLQALSIGFLPAVAIGVHKAAQRPTSRRAEAASEETKATAQTESKEEKPAAPVPAGSAEEKSPEPVEERPTESKEEKPAAPVPAGSAEEKSPEPVEEKAAEPGAAETPEPEKEDPEDAAFDPALQVGAMAPLGFWDPLKLCAETEEGFRKLRAAELKHGRVSMMAAVGAVAQHYITFPGFSSVPRGLDAAFTFPGNLGFVVLLGMAGYAEVVLWKQDSNKEVGDFGDPLGLTNSIGAYDTEMRSKELNNGRFAMFAAIGIIASDWFTGKDAVEQILGI